MRHKSVTTREMGGRIILPPTLSRIICYAPPTTLHRVCRIAREYCCRSQAHEWMHRLQTLLETALGQKMVLPERKLDSIEAFQERFLGGKRVMIDGTLRPIQRPQDPEQQQLNYSGKKNGTLANI